MPLILGPLTITVTIDSALGFTPNGNLPHAVVGQAYTPTSIGTVSGGTSPYTFGSVSGLPSGMSLSSAGALSGTPTAAGQSSVQFSITDSSP